MAQTIKDVLDVCERFVGVVERWGGDVLPGLLEVELEEEGAASVGREVDRRGAMVAEIRDVSIVARSLRNLNLADPDDPGNLCTDPASVPRDLLCSARPICPNPGSHLRERGPLQHLRHLPLRC